MVVVDRDHRESVMDRNCAPKIDGAARVPISYSYEYTSATSLLVVKEFGNAWTTGPDESSCCCCSRTWQGVRVLILRGYEGGGGGTRLSLRGTVVTRYGMRSAWSGAGVGMGWWAMPLIRRLASSACPLILANGRGASSRRAGGPVACLLISSEMRGMGVR